jgi:hypothetical protein
MPQAARGLLTLRGQTGALFPGRPGLRPEPVDLGLTDLKFFTQGPHLLGCQSADLLGPAQPDFEFGPQRPDFLGRFPFAGDRSLALGYQAAPFLPSRIRLLAEAIDLAEQGPALLVEPVLGYRQLFLPVPPDGLHFGVGLCRVPRPLLGFASPRLLFFSPLPLDGSELGLPIGVCLRLVLEDAFVCRRQLRERLLQVAHPGSEASCLSRRQLIAAREVTVHGLRPIGRDRTARGRVGRFPFGFGYGRGGQPGRRAVVHAEQDRTQPHLISFFEACPPDGGPVDDRASAPAQIDDPQT